jgi:hypothetical protein
MMGVETAGQGAVGGQNQLGRGCDETAARDVAAFHGEAELGVEVARHFRRRVALHSFVAKDDSA